MPSVNVPVRWFCFSTTRTRSPGRMFARVLPSTPPLLLGDLHDNAVGGVGGVDGPILIQRDAVRTAKTTNGVHKLPVLENRDAPIVDVADIERVIRSDHHTAAGSIGPVLHELTVLVEYGDAFVIA